MTTARTLVAAIAASALLMLSRAGARQRSGREPGGRLGSQCGRQGERECCAPQLIAP